MQQVYQHLQADLSRGLVFPLRQAPGAPRKMVFNIAKLRQLTLLTSWIDFLCAHNTVMAKSMSSVVASVMQNKCAVYLVQTYHQRGHYEAWHAVVEAANRTINGLDPENYRHMLKFLCWGPPVLRAMLSIIAEQFRPGYGDGRGAGSGAGPSHAPYAPIRPEERRPVESERAAKVSRPRHEGPLLAIPLCAISRRGVGVEILIDPDTEQVPLASVEVASGSAEETERPAAFDAIALIQLEESMLAERIKEESETREIKIQNSNAITPDKRMLSSAAERQAWFNPRSLERENHEEACLALFFSSSLIGKTFEAEVRRQTASVRPPLSNFDRTVRGDQGDTPSLVTDGFEQ
ncbi:hypothetical protein VTN00DRAFT_7076 [Thermoascus crustaceus]|uniref:uncharacterized protein n=1 Tax=Thermoascus crustaceus TaxID=5088 RepID=UPI00374273FE